MLARRCCRGRSRLRGGRLASNGVARRDGDRTAGNLAQQLLIDETVTVVGVLDGAEGDETAEKSGDGLAARADGLAELLVREAEAIR